MHHLLQRERRGLVLPIGGGGAGTNTGGRGRRRHRCRACSLSMNIKTRGGGNCCRHRCRVFSDGGAARQSPSQWGGGRLGPIRQHPPRRPDERIRRRLAAGPPVGRIERRSDRDGAAPAVPARAVGRAVVTAAVPERVVVAVVIVDLRPPRGIPGIGVGRGHGVGRGVRREVPRQARRSKSSPPNRGTGLLVCIVVVVVVVVVDDGNGPDPGPGGSVTFNGAFWEADYPMSFELTSLNEYQDEGGGRGGELPSCYRRGFLFALFYWGGGSSRMSFLIVIMHQTFLYIFSPSIFIIIHVSTPFDSIPLKSVCRDPSDCI